MRRSEQGKADPDLGLLTHRLTSALQRKLAQSFGGEAAGAMGPRHRAVLALLDAEGSRAVDVARRTGLHKQVVGTLVDDLEQTGYVRREPDPSDRRAKLVVPTAAGLRQRAAIDAAMAGIEDALAASLGTRRYRDFKRAFGQVADALLDP